MYPLKQLSSVFDRFFEERSRVVVIIIVAITELEEGGGEGHVRSIISMFNPNDAHPHPQALGIATPTIVTTKAREGRWGMEAQVLGRARECRHT